MHGDLCIVLVKVHEWRIIMVQKSLHTQVDKIYNVINNHCPCQWLAARSRGCGRKKFTKAPDWRCTWAFEPLRSAVDHNRLVVSWQMWWDKVEAETEAEVILYAMCTVICKRLLSSAWNRWRLSILQITSETKFRQAAQKRVLGRTERIVKVLQLGVSLVFVAEPSWDKELRD